MFGSQAGDGIQAYELAPTPNALFQIGGSPVLCASVFAAGSGLRYETDEPYRGTNGTVRYCYMKEDGTMYITGDERYSDLTGTDESILADYPIAYAAYYDDKEDEWTVDESARYDAIVSLVESHSLPSPVITEDDAYIGYDEAATNGIKDELLRRKAVNICFCADTSKPGMETPPKYLNLKTYAHYTHEHMNVNRAVTIVGYDDSYPRENFLDHSADEGGDGLPHLPEGDGAWIVKNSWGTADNAFPHYGLWGTEGSGYFYLSYYDRSLEMAETFSFDVSSLTSAAEQYIVSQYDTLACDCYSFFGEGNDLAMSNVFCAGCDMVLERIGFYLPDPGAEVELKVYLLNDGYTAPEDGQLYETVTDVYKNAGYHTVRLPESVFLKEGTYYSVVLTDRITEDNITKGYAGIGVSYEIVDDMGPILLMQGTPVFGVARTVINPGESFVRVDGTWIDWSTDEAEALRETITDYYTETPLMRKMMEDMEAGILSQEQVMEYMSGELPPEYKKNEKSKAVDNFAVKTYSVKAGGETGTLAYSLDADGVLRITGSGDIGAAMENSMFDYAPWFNLLERTKLVVIDPAVTGVTGDSGELTATLDLYYGPVQIGEGENAVIIR